jgi:curved DNA-binding protein CbpA
MSAKPDKDYYVVLEVEESATRAEIDRQYKRLASKHHPDLGGSEETMKSLNEAYGVLKDHSLRKDYDRGRRYSIPVRETFCSTDHPNSTGCRRLWSRFELAVVFDSRFLFAGASPFPVDLVFVATGNIGCFCSWFRSLDGAQRDEGS